MRPAAAHLALVAASVVPSVGAQEPALLDRVEVARVVIDARIVDGRGRTLPDLKPEEVRVEVDGRPVRLESLDWVPEGTALDRQPATVRAAGTRPGPPGRLIVFLFQKDFERSRLKGLMLMMMRAARLLDTLGPRDRAAVLVFDSHLRLHLDFTSDRERLRRVIERSALQDWPPPPSPGALPSLAAHLDQEAAQRASTPEAGLLVLARALKPLPGSKSLLLFGWGLGHLAAGTVQMGSEYGPARQALAEARTTVFSLDVTEADYHTLEFGLQQIASDTGGFYVKTHDFPAAAMARLEGALAGHYVLAFETPPGRRGHHDVSVNLVGRRGTVLARTFYVD